MLKIFKQSFIDKTFFYPSLKRFFSKSVENNENEFLAFFKAFP